MNDPSGTGKGATPTPDEGHHPDDDPAPVTYARGYRRTILRVKDLDIVSIIATRRAPVRGSGEGAWLGRSRRAGRRVSARPRGRRRPLGRPGGLAPARPGAGSGSVPCATQRARGLPSTAPRSFWETRASEITRSSWPPGTGVSMRYVPGLGLAKDHALGELGGEVVIVGEIEGFPVAEEPEHSKRQVTDRGRRDVNGSTLRHRWPVGAGSGGRSATGRR